MNWTRKREILAHPLVGGLISLRVTIMIPPSYVTGAPDPRSFAQSSGGGGWIEGGRVQRFREGFTCLPAHNHLLRCWEWK